ncbi:DUF922 domain-containing protein [Mesorhizobium sp. M0119]|uniref:DUF922 domain-containing protein n=1 Tax=unclassified Mesorhizobium TaxID=325217 RepID=UPI003338F7DA
MRAASAASNLFAALAMAGTLICASVAQAGVKVIPKDTPYGITGISTKEIGRQLTRRGGAKLTATIRREIEFAHSEPSTCYVREADYTLYLITTYPRLEGKVSPKLRKRWNAFLSTVVASDAKTRQWAIQTTNAMDELTANLSMKNDRSCNRLRSFVAQRLHSIDQKFKKVNQQYVDEQNGPNGAVGKATTEFYREP